MISDIVGVFFHFFPFPGCAKNMAHSGMSNQLHNPGEIETDGLLITLSHLLINEAEKSFTCYSLTKFCDNSMLITSL